MKVFMPRYYRDFQCIASACPDSCCKEWAVDIDAQAADFYRGLDGELGKKLHSVLKEEDGCTVMSITDGRCPMWREDGLCQIQAELGHAALCKTCREFPRLRHDYGDFMELGLELSCPEAARLILAATSSDFLEESTDENQDAEYDADVMDTLLRSRDVVLRFLGSGVYPIPQALAIILLYAHDVQAEIDGGLVAEFDPESCLTDALNYAQQGNMQSLFAFYRDLEILAPHWAARLDGSPVSHNWKGPYQALAIYFVQRYWLQAVADYDLVCRVKFMIAACLLICGLGGDVVATAQRFSKEIENDPDNVETILDGAYSAPAMTDVNLLSLLLG